MSKFLRFSSVFILLTFLFGVSPSGQSGLVTFFGPEIFICDTGKAIEEIREFSAANFQAPFILHLRNGDDFGNNRISSAKIWLNDELIFSPEYFSQEAWGYDIAIELHEQNILKVLLKSKPGSFLKIWIEGQPINLFDFEEVTIFPTAGIYNLSNGITLDVPEGAVSEALTIRLRRVEGEEVMPTLLGFDIGNMYFMAGFEAEGGPIQFNMPIDVTLPAEPLVNSTCLPFPFNVNPEENAISLVNAGSLAGSFMRTMKIVESQDVVETLVAIYDCSTNTVTFKSLEEFPGDKWVTIQALMDKILEHSDCIQNPCRCCNIEVYVKESDLEVANKCGKFVSEGSVIYKDCPNEPKEGWDINEQTVHIEYDLNLDTNEIDVCNTNTLLNVRIYEADEEGNPISYLDDYPVSVTSNDTTCLLVEQEAMHTFRLLANKVGIPMITIDAGCEITQQFEITVNPLFELYPENAMELKIDESKQLSVIVQEECGVPIENPGLIWTIPVGIVSVDLTDPTNPLVTGFDLGQTTLTVTYIDISKSIYITVYDDLQGVWEIDNGFYIYLFESGFAQIKMDGGIFLSRGRYTHTNGDFKCVFASYCDDSKELWYTLTLEAELQGDRMFGTWNSYDECEGSGYSYEFFAYRIH